MSRQAQSTIEPKRSSATPSVPPALSRAERSILYVLMLLSPLLLLGVAEGGLRMVGYGADYPLFVPVDGHEAYLYQNREVARRYFANLESIPTSLLDFFPAEKQEGTFRIFVQGGSSAAGFPFYYGGAFSRMLEQRLAQTYPERRIEMVNTAMAAVNSYTMLDLVPEILAQKPDAVLIYAGHNEFYGALGVGSSESLGRLPALKRAYLRLRRLRTVQALRDLLTRGATLFGGRGEGRVPNWTMMSQMVGEQRIPLDSPLFRDGIAQFRSNLRALLGTYRRHGVPVFVGTLASNEADHAPFIGAPNRDAAGAFRRGQRAAAGRRFDEARTHFEAARSSDPLSADVHFALGRIHALQGRYPEARAAYLAAKDRDELRFRAPEAMNQVIRELAAESGATVVDVQDALARHAPHGMIDAGVMTEHLHPNVEGYFLMADAFYGAITSTGIIAAAGARVGPNDARRELLLTPVDSMVGMMRIQKLRATWPFQPLGVVDRSMDTLTARSTVEQIALDLFRERINWRQANDALRTHYEREGSWHDALQAALVQIQEFPFVDLPYLHAGNVLVRQGRFEEAIAYFENALAVEESAVAHRMIGSILLQRGSRVEAVAHLERAVELDPNDVQALYNLAGAHALERRYQVSRGYAERALNLAPDHGDARRLLESLP